MSALLENVMQEMQAVQPSELEPGTKLYPCAVRLLDGTTLNRVVLINSATARRLFGPSGLAAVSERLRVPTELVASVAESPERLPARFANEIYREGETHYGIFTFTLVFSRWRRQRYLTGGFIDFPVFPGSYGPMDVKEVILRSGADRASPAKEVKWCVYGD
jgi:hypothetical protein